MRGCFVPFDKSTRPVPSTLATGEFVLRPITAADADRDYAAVMETREYLRLWEQTGWPEEGFTVEENRDDLVDLEQRHADGRAFTYTVLDPADTECLGCVYVFHTDASFLAKSTVTPVGGDRWEEVDLVVYFWVRLSRMGVGTDEPLLAALRAWFADEWMSKRTVFVTSELFAQQIAMLERSGLLPRFELMEPGKPGKYLVFG